MFTAILNSFKRKIARRYTKKYPVRVDTFDVPGYGAIKFANWENPLVEPKSISLANVEFFRKFLREGDLAIDIGANIGHTTVPLALLTGPSGLTLGFDPNPYVFEILAENTKLNPGKITIAAHNFAITETDGEFYYNSSEASFNNGGISTEKNNKHGKYSLSTKIKGVNLHAFLQANHADKLDRLKLVKIDTEGYDKEIIKSISGLLDRYKPVVITECFGKNSKEERFEQFNLLHAKGYSLYYFSDFSSDAEIVPITTPEDMLKWKHFDLYAVAE
ncbi:FkbM family methyltransferase [Hymenobacter weizhouensis]|uniref:FkbM family methyltransferase n=1 Tax=Hymenobacter sp. YIM 151500-1 TaxID=2987689 RepID=UPI002227DDFB|nr:FkbM family methyltransferase [Hymenobacter sp. YIM 151500-1]UYZ65185.1 FkbM family methyltransferase [Hymenobacter sp. YIM 151500-1]